MSNNANFHLHQRLEADSFLVGRSADCQIRMINDQRYPWLIVVPEQPNILEIHDLGEKQRQSLHLLTDTISQLLAQGFGADKMNVAAIGNLVPQLHIHIIARFKTDAVWPAPVWGNGVALPYARDARSRQLDLFRNLLSGLLV